MPRKIANRETAQAGIDLSAVGQAIKRTQEYLLRAQSEEGYWVGVLEADASVAAGYIPLMYFLTGSVDPERQQKVINYLRIKQKRDGSWTAYFDGPGDISVTIQNYFALKLAGISPQEPFMKQAREFVLAHGGITKANVLTKIWLSIFGQYDWWGTPSIPPELVLLPNWFYFNIYEFASWSRATIMALMVVLTTKPLCRVPEFADVSELYVEAESSRNYSLGKAKKAFSWETFFLCLDRLFKAWERLPWKPGRNRALKKAEKWIVAHQEADGSWGGIMLPWVYSLIALKGLGYSLDHPVIAKGMAGLESFLVEDSQTLWLQPATSPVWDTAWAVVALSESGLPSEHPALVKTARWLLKEEIRISGDWQVKNPRTEPGCWAFEFENDLYPDIDDTALVARALCHVRLPEEEEKNKAGAIKRGLDWTLSMQSKDGGWGAFDRDNNKEFLAHIPFADFMTPLDPSSPDVTAHVIELLGELKLHNLSLRKAITYLKKGQEPDGAWYGRWGVNYVYGTGLVLAGLQAVGENMSQDYVGQAASWLESHQNEDGGWGETCHTYADPSCRGTGLSTASQTAWALLGLLAAGRGASQAAQKGIGYLLKKQQGDGSWLEEAYTGTGFPRAFYLRYDLYRIYFPLLVLSRYKAFLVSGKHE